MDIFSQLLVVIVILSLCIYAIERVPVPGSAPFKPWIEVLFVIIAALYLAQHFLHL